VRSSIHIPGHAAAPPLSFAASVLVSVIRTATIQKAPIGPGESCGDRFDLDQCGWGKKFQKI
jgi:hypothetical protein